MTMRNIKLVLEYDGTDFHGWQSQPNVRNVQDELERSLSTISQEDIRVTVAGRTDTGVHALGQVVNFKTKSLLPLETFQRGGNALLPRDVRILSAEPVEEDFSARFSARFRSYRYVISQRPSAIDRNFTWYFPLHLDISEMDNACSCLYGENDFKSFCQAGSQVNHYRCFVHHASWSKTDDKIIFNVIANRFLHNMVRSLVGTLLEVGQKKISSDEMIHILKAQNRCAAGPTAPPQGLFLVQVGYNSFSLSENYNRNQS